MRHLLAAFLLTAAPASGYDFAGASLAHWPAGAEEPDAYYDSAIDTDTLSLDWDDGSAETTSLAEESGVQRPATDADRAALQAMIDSQLRGLSMSEGLAPAGEKLTLALDFIGADVTFTVTRTFAAEAVPAPVTAYFCGLYENKVVGLTCP